MILKRSITIPKKPEDVQAPLSLAQQRLWFIYQLDTQSPVYNISRAWRLRGRLNRKVLKSSLNLLVARHEALRTTFQEINGQPVQIIQPASGITLQEQDCSSYSPAQLDSEINRVVTEEPLKPFNLTTDPLIRFRLLRCGPDEHVFLLIVHHIVFDGTSLKNFCKELSLSYLATATGQALLLAPLPIQYQDFAFWQQSLGNDYFLAKLEYWQQQLEGAPLVLDLPSDWNRPKEISGEGGLQRFMIEPLVISRLNQLIRPRGVTVFMALLGVFQILLARYSGQRDLLVGAPIAGRTNADFEEMMGFFVNRLVLRAQLKGEPTYYDVLGQVRKTCLEGYRYQDLPFEKLVEVLQPTRDPSRSPVVQFIFQLRQSSDLQLTFPEISAQPFPVTRRTGNTDLHLVCEETGSAIQGFLYYSKTLFPDAMMVEFTRHYHNLVEQLIDNPQQSIWRVPFLTESECHLQLHEWNDASAAYSLERTIGELVEEQAACRPGTVAVIFEEQLISFGCLNARVNQLAHHLRRQGVGPEVIVGLCTERSVEMIVGLLGILKAGGAYLPLDPTLPKERLNYMIEAAPASVILSQKSVLAKVAHLPQPIVCLDADVSRVWKESPQNPICHTLPGHLMYVLYTSGSTGHPKGVTIEHRQFLNYLYGIIDRLDLSPDNHYALVSPLSADAGHTVLFPSLCRGGTLHVVSRERISDPDSLAEYFERQPPDYLKIVPSHLDALLTSTKPELLLPQKQLLMGGESCNRNLLRKVHTLAPSVRVTNHYGPTETTVGVTTCHIKDAEIQDKERWVPIGHSLPNTQIYIVDSYLQPVPIGVVGELYVSGHGVARGYATHPALTAERFIPNPFCDDPGARMYRTGDLARYRADRTLEFLGRADHQVKIRGYRIELGEIEAVLRHHAGIREAVVLLREDRSEDKQLVAYVLSNSSNPTEVPTRGELINFLKGQLPDHAVPTEIVALDTFPLTSNGKIDRRALPEPESSNPQSRQHLVAPRTAIEATLLKVWQEVLGVEQIGIHDNFFELGGHSLLAIKVMARIRTSMHRDISLRTLFEQPTVAGLAGGVDQAQGIAMSNVMPEEDLTDLINDLDIMSEEEAQVLLEAEQQDEKSQHSP